ncbi:MAG: hypothetical protein FJ098_11215, partial [Deltaproteobacteria bacterium]|nr:hypothetical protein [Deltaproteobacteria bacterium]
TVTDCDYSGRAYKSPNTGDIEEFDITFEPDAESWNFGDPEFWEIGVDTCFQEILLHEIGHGLGFKHTGGDYDVLSIMGHKTGKFVGDRLVGFKPWDMGHLRYHYPDGTTPGPDLVYSNYTTFVNDNGGFGVELIESDTASRFGDDGLREADFFWTRMNLGATASTGSFSSAVFLSEDEVLDEGDRLVDVWSVHGGVAEHSEGFFTRTVSFSDQVAGGTYYVLLDIDAVNDVAETDETNNVMPLPERLYLGGIATDLAITEVRLAAPYEEHILEPHDPSCSASSPALCSWRTLTFRVQVQNLHTQNASLPVSLTLLYDNMWSTSGMPGSLEETLPALAAGEVVEVELEVDVPVYTSSAQPATSLLFALDRHGNDWDPDELVDIDPSNNEASLSIDFDWFRPDYVMALGLVGYLPGPINRAVVNWTVTNIGPEPAALPSFVGVRLNGSLLSSLAVGALDYGEGASGQVEAKVSATTAALLGFSLSFSADETDVLAESDEGNNLAVVTFSRGVDPEDLKPKTWAPRFAEGLSIPAHLLASPVEMLDLDLLVGSVSDWIRDLILMGSPGPFLPDVLVLSPGTDAATVVALFQTSAVLTPVLRMTSVLLTALRKPTRVLVSAP